MDEDDTQLILKQYNEKFITYELSPGIYTINDISEAAYTMGDREGTLKIEYDDFTTKTKLILTGFGSTFGTLGFNEKFFFQNTLLGFTPYWDYKQTNAIHADSPGVYTSDKILNLITKDKNHLKTNVIDGSIANRLRQPIFFSFVLDRPSGFEVFCQTETIHYKKINKSVLNTTTFF